MKLRPMLLALAALYLMGAPASAGQTTADSMNASLAAIFTAPASPDCADATLPSFEPAPTEKAGIPCGPCSDSICQGKQNGQICAVQGPYVYKCRFAMIVCEPTDCQCWHGPLP